MAGGFNFDEIIDRRNTNCIKWDGIERAISGCDDGDSLRNGDRATGVLPSNELLPMWVADMDFRAPSVVLDRIRAAVDHGIFGYTEVPGDVWEAVTAWVESRYRWSVDPSWMSYTAGVITGLNVAIQTFTRPGEKIVIQPPVYPPFHSSVLSNGRRIVYNPLRRDDDIHGRYRFDLEGLRSLVDRDTRMLVLCNPHNPVGRAWSREELEGIAEIALERDLLVFSDEIHADLILDDLVHCPFASLGPEIAQRTITGIAPSKTFNIAGLKASVIITPNEKLRADFDCAQSRTFGLYHANTFAVVGMHAAYAYGGEWLDAVLAYLQENRDSALQYLARHVPGVRAATPEATFLLWLDFAGTGLAHEEIVRVLREDAQIILNDGTSFGPGGDRCFRLNFGCPRALLDTGMERLGRAFSAREAIG